MKTYSEFINEVDVGDWLIDKGITITGGMIAGGITIAGYKGWSKIKRKKFDRQMSKINKKAEKDIKRANGNEQLINDIKNKRDADIDKITKRMK